MIPNEHACERMILRLDDDALSGPLPELSLGRPELLGIATDYEGRVLALLSLFFFFFLFAQNVSLLPVQSVWIGLIDFHYYSSRTFSRSGGLR